MKNALKGELNWKSIEIQGIDHRDYPDYVDAYASYAEYDNGTPLSDEELDILNDQYRDEVYDIVQDKALDAACLEGDALLDAYKHGDHNE